MSENRNYRHSFDDEDMSPAGQERARQRREADERNYRARELARGHTGKGASFTPPPKPKEEPVRFTNGIGINSTTKGKGQTGSTFAELLTPVQRALENLTKEERTKARLGSDLFKTGMNLYYNALNSPFCIETNKVQYHRDAKECQDLEDLYVLISMYIEEYFTVTSQVGDADALMFKRRSPAPSKEETEEMARQSWF